MSAEPDFITNRKAMGIQRCIEKIYVQVRKPAYDLGEFHLYMGGGFYELGNKICLMRFRPELMPDNTELWELDTQTGAKKTDRTMA